MNRDELSLSKAFEDWSFGSGNILAVVAGAVLLRVGWTFVNVLTPPGLVGLIAILYVYLAGLGLLVAGATGVDMHEYGRHLAYVAFGLLASAAVVVYLVLASTHPGSDAAVFMSYSADLVLAGKNPYATGMEGAWNATNVTTLSVTPKIDGTHVTSYSYPSGLIVAAIPVRALGLSVSRLTVFTSLLVLGFLVLESPPEWALAPIAALLANNWLHISFLGSVDVLWVLPVLLAMNAWARTAWLRVGIWLGLAASMKPQPWLILPFLAIELYRRREGRAFATVALAGTTTALLVNLPFLIWNSTAWLQGVLTPFLGNGASLVHDGVGLTMLTTTGVFVLPKSWYLGIFGGFYLISLAAALHLGDRVRWVWWAVPLALLFANYRSLHSYFVVIVPIAYYATLLATDRRDDRIGFPGRKTHA